MDSQDSSKDLPSQPNDPDAQRNDAAELPPLEPACEVDGEPSSSQPAEMFPTADEAWPELPQEPVVAPGDEPPPVAPPPDAPKQDTFPTRLLIGAGVFAFLLLVGAGFLWKAHSDLGALRREVAVLKAQAQRAQVLQERAALLRVRAELQSLRQTVSPELSLEVDRADGILTGIDDRLKAAQ